MHITYSFAQRLTNELININFLAPRLKRGFLYSKSAFPFKKKRLRVIDTLKEYVLENEQYCENVHQGADLLSLAGHYVQHNVGDNAEADAFGDGIEQRHCNNGNVCGNGFAQVIAVEAYLGNGAYHQESDHYQRGRRCKGRNRSNERSKESAQ